MQNDAWVLCVDKRFAACRCVWPTSRAQQRAASQEKSTERETGRIQKSHKVGGVGSHLSCCPICVSKPARVHRTWWYAALGKHARACGSRVKQLNVHVTTDHLSSEMEGVCVDTSLARCVQSKRWRGCRARHRAYKHHERASARQKGKKCAG